jgi:hypothetical protein
MWGVGVWIEVGVLIHPTGVFGIQVRTLGWEVHFWKLTVHKPFPYRPCFMAGSIVMPIQTINTELIFYRRQRRQCMQRVKMSLYTSAFRFPSSIKRGPRPFHEKHPHTVMSPPPNFTFGMAGIVHQAFAIPKPSHRTATWYSVVHHPKSHVSSSPLSSGVAIYTTLGGA